MSELLKLKDFGEFHLKWNPEVSQNSLGVPNPHREWDESDELLDRSQFSDSSHQKQSEETARIYLKSIRDCVQSVSYSGETIAAGELPDHLPKAFDWNDLRERDRILRLPGGVEAISSGRIRTTRSRKGA